MILGWGLDMWKKTQEEELREMSDGRSYLGNSINWQAKDDWPHAFVAAQF